MNMEPRTSGSARAADAGSPGVSDAFERVYESGQRLLMTRVDLFVAELRVIMSGTLWAALAALVSIFGIFWLSYGLVELLQGVMPRGNAAMVVGAVEVLLGIGLAVWASRRISDGST